MPVAMRRSAKRRYFVASSRTSDSFWRLYERGANPRRAWGRAQDKRLELQRQRPGADDRGQRGRPRASRLHQQAARADDHSLARAGDPDRDGRHAVHQPSAWYAGNTVLVGVAQARDVEFEAKYVGDWMLHCHLPHHMMNQMVPMIDYTSSAVLTASSA